MSKHHRTSSTFIVGLWISMLLFSLFIVALLTETFLRIDSSREIKSLDWAGYIVFSDTGDPQPVIRTISASWIIPEAHTSPRDTFSAVWIGIGGQQDDTLIQIGTGQDSVDGQVLYTVWYELLPDYAVTITTMNVSAGDKITASISLIAPSTDQWKIEIIDATSGQGFKHVFAYPSSRLTAEWIVERPTVKNKISSLADFESVTFTDMMVSVDSKSGTLLDFPFSRVTMYDRQNNDLVTVSAHSAGGSTFTVNYLG